MQNMQTSIHNRKRKLCNRANKTKLECGPMPNVMAALPNIGGALCSRPQSLADAITRVPCTNAANIGERKTWTQSEFCTGQNSIRAIARENVYNSVPAQETANDRAKFGWPPVSDVAVVRKPRRETR